LSKQRIEIRVPGLGRKAPVLNSAKIEWVQIHDRGAAAGQRFADVFHTEKALGSVSDPTADAMLLDASLD